MDNNKRKLPAYPLLIKDPYFSIWSASDVLNEVNTSFWNGKSKKTYGIITANNKSWNKIVFLNHSAKLTFASPKPTSRVPQVGYNTLV